MTRTETIYLYLCAKADRADDAVIDLYQCDPQKGRDGHIQGCHLEGWWESLPVTPNESGAAGPDDFDAALTAHGYRRIDNWRKRTGHAGCLRYSAYASIAVTLEDV
ncbi:hypothetical protein GV791_30890 [Nocardia cyriacigeorgica]|uniref:Uncharacterized protein n=1 Tax=Nocardia cyriacigeorgica TaxID=135487 RepID=A0A6P1DBA0_9NOCA|nr:hypothetical protein [Nocardia cyriacigeorgica]NEW36925.1 hypothetical protein [Nocardia cyriacigeorgica]NEW42530.1 hypothetical protein [Nocardia cyriacigeorgica]NEW48035.1 hypothetical protein [Nocardia cyriacigeorgica]